MIDDRRRGLGVETAFNVSAEAAAHDAAGNRVFPFHLGDMNLPTPANIVDATLRAIKDGKTGYCPVAGIPQLRQLLAKDINRARGTTYKMENVSIQPGGKPVIAKFFMTILSPGDEVIYPNPGYPIYETQIRFNGAVGVPYGYKEAKDGFRLDTASIAKLVTPRTKAIVLNDLQNPNGAEASPQELQWFADLAIRNNLWVLCDEAYFDIRYQGKSHSLTSLPGMQERCVILYTFSKKYAMTGWRLGAAVGPTDVINIITKINANIESCSNHFIQYGAIEALTGDQTPSHEILKVLQTRRDRAVEILNSIPGIRCFTPNATFYLFPNVTEAMSRKGMTNYETFRKAALHDTGVSFCTREHFGPSLPGETQKYIRLAYSGIDVADIEEGLLRLKKWIG